MIFLNYAREDLAIAKQISDALDDAGVEHWFDKKKMMVGQFFKPEIKRALRASNYIVLLLSDQSVSKTGFVQIEIKEAIELQAERPSGQVYLLPVRIDECEPTAEALTELHWLDLFPDPDATIPILVQQLKALAGSRPAVETLPSHAPEPQSPAATPIPEEPVAEPFVAALKEYYALIPQAHERKEDVAFFVNFSTRADGVDLPKKVQRSFPDLTPVVLQYQYENLSVDDEKATVTLWFKGIEHEVHIPHAAVRSVDCRTLDFYMDPESSDIATKMHRLRARIADLGGA